MDTLSTTDGIAQPVSTEEPFDIRLAARHGYPLPRLAGGAEQGGGGDAADGGATDSFDADGGQGNGLYDLSSAPEELRPYLQEQLQQVGKNVDSKFREAADYKSRMSPYDELGIGDVPVEDMQELLQFRELLGDREGFTQWLQSAAEQMGVDLGGEQPAMDHSAWYEYGQENGFLEDGEGEAPDDQSSAQQQMMSMLQEQMSPINEFMQQQQLSQQQQQQDDAVSGAEQELSGALEALGEEHGEFDRAAVIGLAHAYVDQDDPIGAAFAEYQRIVGTGQSDMFDAKGDQPAAALSNGQTDTSPPKFNGLNDPALKEAARARFAAST